MKFNYKFPLNELAIKPPKLRFCLAKYKFYAGCFRKNVEHFLTLYIRHYKRIEIKDLFIKII